MNATSCIGTAAVLLLCACDSAPHRSGAVKNSEPATAGSSASIRPAATTPAPVTNMNTSMDRNDEVNATSTEPGVHRVDDQMIFRTDDFTLSAGEERYLCWAATAPEDFRVRGYEYAGRPTVHHFLFYQTSTPEPEEFVDCGDVSIKSGWQILFGSGAGKTKLDFPADAAQTIAKGTQFVVQLHLLNVASQPVTDSARLIMHRSKLANPVSVQMGVIGNFGVSLPPLQKSQIVTECEIASDVRLVGIWPHMHYLGTSLTIELDPNVGSKAPFYERNPYVFDRQTIDSMDVVVPRGTRARVTCNYENTRDQTVGYGESSNNEMCFVLTFSAGPGMTPCITGFPRGLGGAR